MIKDERTLTSPTDYSGAPLVARNPDAPPELDQASGNTT